MAAIALEGVTKEYGAVTALRDLDLTVEDGEVYGFLGPNGAGKSTTIDLLLDYARPTAGRVSVLGLDATADALEIHQRTGILPEGYAVYDRLSAREHIEFMCESKGCDDDPHAVLDRVGIADAADRAAGGFSKGMAQRLVLGMALVGEPELLILDEPSTGLDPNGAREMREIVRAERDRGATVFFSSHVLEQVEAVCDRVGILQDGELIAEDTPDALRDAVEAETTIRITTDRVTDEAVERIRSLDGVTGVSTDANVIVVEYTGDANMEVTTAIEETGVTVRDVETESASLEDLFAAYTGGSRHATSGGRAPVGSTSDRGEVDS